MANEGFIKTQPFKDRSVNYWKDAIRCGQRFQRQYGGSANWKAYKDYYRHNWGKGILPVNQIFSIMRSMVAQTALRNPSVTVTATQPGLVNQLQAKLVETIDRWLLRELMVKREIKMMLQDSFLTGIACGFNGYDSEYGWAPGKAIGDASATLTQFDKKGYRIEYNSHINPGMPWFLRARPDDVVWPWGTTSKDNAEWVALRVLRPIADLKADAKYRVPKDFNGSYVPYRTGPEGEVKQDHQDSIQSVQEWVELWQIHDAKTGKIFVIAMEADEFLRKDTDLMQVDGLPVEILTPNPDPDYIYGIADAKIIEPQQLEINEIRTQAMKHRRVDLIKLLVKKGSMKPEAINKMLDEDIKAVVEIEADAVLRDSAMPFPSGVAGVLQDMAFCADASRQDIRESIGFSRNQVGEYQGKTHVTKAETMQVAGRGDIRMDERRDGVADLLTNIVRKFNQTIFTHWTLPQVKSIVGPDGGRYWLQFTGPEIKNEYSIKIDPASAETMSLEAKKQDAMEMAKAWAEMNAGQVSQGVPVPAEIQRYLFSQYEGINIEKLLQEQGIQGGGQPPQIPMGIGQAAQSMQGGRR